jgi:hypothetical protein
MYLYIHTDQSPEIYSSLFIGEKAVRNWGARWAGKFYTVTVAAKGRRYVPSGANWAPIGGSRRNDGLGGQSTGKYGDVAGLSGGDWEGHLVVLGRRHLPPHVCVIRAPVSCGGVGDSPASACASACATAAQKRRTRHRRG